MAIKIYEQFAPFANPADGDYPYGSIKNDSIPGAEDGTPLDAVWANDYAGTDAELFAQAGIVPNGQPDKLGASQRVEALIKIITGRASIKSFVHIQAEDYGVKPGIDSTLQLKAALDAAEALGGGVVELPYGTIKVSINTSPNDYSCVLIPANVTLRGKGRYATTLTRLDSERGQNGVIVCNKNYDTVGDYGAAGNIIIEHLGITDGASWPLRTHGNLIGFGNGDGLIVQYCWFGNHDQHAVDICKSRNVVIRWNDSYTDVSGGDAVYQIDAGLIWGIFNGTEKDTTDVYIYENNIKYARCPNIIHFHNGNYSKNIYIYRNNINGNALVGGQSAIGGDNDISYENVHIYENTITLSKINTRAIHLAVQDEMISKIDGLHIYRNTIKGKYRIGIFVGDDVPLSVNYNGTLQSVYIHDNDFYADLTLPELNKIRLATAAHFKHAEIVNNNFYISVNGQTQYITVINDNNNGTAIVRGNNIYQLDDGSTAPTDYYGIESEYGFSLSKGVPKHFDISDNNLDMNNVRYHIRVPYTASVASYSNYTGSISRNEMTGEPVMAHIFESTELSDGSNNRRYIDFTGKGAVASDPFILDLTAATRYDDIPLTGKKISFSGVNHIGLVSFDVMYSPQPGGSGFNNDTESLSFAYISATQCAGTTIADVNTETGTFGIVTGSDGVSVIINNITFQPVLRPFGSIKILSGI